MVSKDLPSDPVNRAETVKIQDITVASHGNLSEQELDTGFKWDIT